LQEFKEFKLKGQKKTKTEYQNENSINLYLPKSIKELIKLLLGETYIKKIKIIDEILKLNFMENEIKKNMITKFHFNRILIEYLKCVCFLPIFYKIEFDILTESFL